MRRIEKKLTAALMGFAVLLMASPAWAGIFGGGDDKEGGGILKKISDLFDALERMWKALERAYGYAEWAYHKSNWLSRYVLQLLESGLFRFPVGWQWLAWAGWYFVLTQPKPVDRLWAAAGPPLAKAGSWANKPESIPGAGGAIEAIFKMPLMIGPLLRLFYYLSSLPLQIIGGLAQAPAFFRFAVTLATMNVMVNGRAGTWLAGYVQQNPPADLVTLVTRIVRWAPLGLIPLWYLLRSAESRAHARDVIAKAQKHHGRIAGWVIGLATLAAEDFIPVGAPKEQRVCKGREGVRCGRLHDRKQDFCPHCKTKNEEAAWKCRYCGQTGNDAEWEFCPRCSEDRYSEKPLPDEVECMGCTQVIKKTWACCPHCGTASPRSSWPCETCRQNKVRQENPDGAAFCVRCGTARPNVVMPTDPVAAPSADDEPQLEQCPQCGNYALGPQYCTSCDYERPADPAAPAPAGRRPPRRRA